MQNFHYRWLPLLCTIIYQIKQTYSDNSGQYNFTKNAPSIARNSYVPLGSLGLGVGLENTHHLPQTNVSSHPTAASLRASVSCSTPVARKIVLKNFSTQRNKRNTAILLQLCAADYWRMAYKYHRIWLANGMEANMFNQDDREQTRTQTRLQGHPLDKPFSTDMETEDEVKPIRFAAKGVDKTKYSTEKSGIYSNHTEVRYSETNANKSEQSNLSIPRTLTPSFMTTTLSTLEKALMVFAIKETTEENSTDSNQSVENTVDPNSNNKQYQNTPSSSENQQHSSNEAAQRENNPNTLNKNRTHTLKPVNYPREIPGITKDPQSQPELQYSKATGSTPQCPIVTLSDSNEVNKLQDFQEQPSSKLIPAKESHKWNGIPGAPDITLTNVSTDKEGGTQNSSEPSESQPEPQVNQNTTESDVGANSYKFTSDAQQNISLDNPNINRDEYNYEQTSSNALVEELTQTDNGFSQDSQPEPQSVDNNGDTMKTVPHEESENETGNSEINMQPSGATTVQYSNLEEKQDDRMTTDPFANCSAPTLNNEDVSRTTLPSDECSQKSGEQQAENSEHPSETTERVDSVEATPESNDINGTAFDNSDLSTCTPPNTEGQNGSILRPEEKYPLLSPTPSTNAQKNKPYPHENTENQTSKNISTSTFKEPITCVSDSTRLKFEPPHTSTHKPSNGHQTNPPLNASESLIVQPFKTISYEHGDEFEEVKNLTDQHPQNQIEIAKANQNIETSTILLSSKKKAQVMDILQPLNQRNMTIGTPSSSITTTSRKNELHSLQEESLSKSQSEASHEKTEFKFPYKEFNRSYTLESTISTVPTIQTAMESEQKFNTSTCTPPPAHSIKFAKEDLTNQHSLDQPQQANIQLPTPNPKLSTKENNVTSNQTEFQLEQTIAETNQTVVEPQLLVPKPQQPVAPSQEPVAEPQQPVIQPQDTGAEHSEDGLGVHQPPQLVPQQVQTTMAPVGMKKTQVLSTPNYIRSRFNASLNISASAHNQDSGLDLFKQYQGFISNLGPHSSNGNLFAIPKITTTTLKPKPISYQMRHAPPERDGKYKWGWF